MAGRRTFAALSMMIWVRVPHNSVFSFLNPKVRRISPSLVSASSRVKWNTDAISSMLFHSHPGRSCCWSTSTSIASRNSLRVKGLLAAATNRKARWASFRRSPRAIRRNARRKVSAKSLGSFERHVLISSSQDWEQRS